MQNVRIQTAQNVFIEYQPASVGDRIIAAIIDVIIVWSYIIGCVTIVASLNIDINWVIWILVITPLLFYDLAFEIFMDGQTIGKKARSIKVVKLNGSQPTIGSYLLRWLIRPIDVLFSGAVAILVISLNGKGQRLGDIAAGTSVVNLRRRVGLSDMMVPQTQEDYEPVYPQATSLSDRDIALIKEALLVHTNSDEPDIRLLETLARKVKGALQVESNMPPMAFLRTILKDHTHLTSNG